MSQRTYRDPASHSEDSPVRRHPRSVELSQVDEDASPSHRQMASPTRSTGFTTTTTTATAAANQPRRSTIDPSPFSSPMGRADEGHAAGEPSLTVGAAMEATIAHCQQRGLTDTATWVSELMLDATPQLVARRLSRTPSLLNTLIAREAAQDRLVMLAPAVQTGCAPAGVTTAHANEEAAAAVAASMAATTRWRSYQTMALGLFHKAEYQRCHHYLVKAMHEVDEAAALGKKRSRTAAGLEAARRTPEGRGDDEDLARGERPLRRVPVSSFPDETPSSPAPQTSPAEEAAYVASSFATTGLPPSLSFLSLYALYMDGQKVKTTSANPHRTRNPHLRVLRILLTEALRNPTNHLSSMRQTTGPVSASTGPFQTSDDGSHVRDGSGTQHHDTVQSISAITAGAASTPHASVNSMGGASPAVTGAAGADASGGGNEARGSAATAAAANKGSGSRLRLSTCDPYLTWLMGVVLRDLGLRQESATYFLASVRVNPLLWCAWEDMASLVSREAQLEDIAQAMSDAEPSFMLEIFLALAKASLGVPPLVAVRSSAGGPYSTLSASSPMPAPESPLTAKDGGGGSVRHVNAWEYLLAEGFPRSLYLLSQLAGFHYHHRRDLERAERLYQQIHKADPYRLDIVVDYSNLLFMKSDRLSLASLAQKVYQAAPFRAESNFVVGNYYVLLGQHDRSVLHFRRAVAIQPSFVGAWTLLGHAYVETRNTTAAVEAYRTAVELDPRDYRGWYNLGQIYELLQAYHHALYYYWHTTSLRPTDPRMWTAVANCLEHEGRPGESVVCLERAMEHEAVQSELYPALARRIATYYVGIRYFDKACVFLEKLTQSRAASREDMLFALPFLIQHRVNQAHRLCELPARSPSYEPFVARGGGGGSGSAGSSVMGSPVSSPGGAGMGLPIHRRQGSAEATSAPMDPRAESALKKLSAAEEYLRMMQSLLGEEAGTGAGTMEEEEEGTEEEGRGGVDSRQSGPAWGDGGAESAVRRRSYADGGHSASVASSSPHRRAPAPPPPPPVQPQLQTQRSNTSGASSRGARPTNQVERFIYDMQRRVEENRRLIRLQMRQ